MAQGWVVAGSISAPADTRLVRASEAGDDIDAQEYVVDSS
jgi:hypothetical protein